MKIPSYDLSSSLLLHQTPPVLYLWYIGYLSSMALLLFYLMLFCAYICCISCVFCLISDIQSESNYLIIVCNLELCDGIYLLCSYVLLPCIICNRFISGSVVVIVITQYLSIGEISMHSLYIYINALSFADSFTGLRMIYVLLSLLLTVVWYDMAISREPILIFS